MTDEGRDKVMAAIWRSIDKLAGAIERLSDRLVVQALDGEVPQRAETPEQPPLPGMPEDWTPPQIEAKKPREWCNTVKVYDWLKDHFTASFTLLDMMNYAGDITEATGGKVREASFARILSTLRRAYAIYKNEGNGKFYVATPVNMDDLRETIERVARKRKEVAAWNRRAGEETK